MNRQEIVQWTRAFWADPSYNVYITLLQVNRCIAILMEYMFVDLCPWDGGWLDRKAATFSTS
jgi:hypothetical protein